MDVVAEAVKSVWDGRDAAGGLRMVYEPAYLRFFQARFEPLVPAEPVERSYPTRKSASALG
jgi:hypothetical protein